MPTNSALISDSTNRPIRRYLPHMSLVLCGMILAGLSLPLLNGANAWQIDPIGAIQIEFIANQLQTQQSPSSLFTGILTLIMVPIESLGNWTAWAVVATGVSVISTLGTLALVMRRTRRMLIAPALLSTPGILLAATSVSPVMLSVFGITLARRTPGKTLRFLIWLTAILVTLTTPNTLALAQWSEAICVPIGVAGAVLAVIRLGRKSTISDAVPTLIYAALIGFGGYPTLPRPDLVILGIAGILLTILDRPFTLDRRWVGAIGIGICIQIILSAPYYVGIASGQLRQLSYQSSIPFQDWHHHIPKSATITVTGGVSIDYSTLRHPGQINRATTGSDLLNALERGTTPYVLIDESDPMFLSQSPETQGVANQIITLIQATPDRWQPVASGTGWRLLQRI